MESAQDESERRLGHDLAGLTQGEVLVDPLTRALYSTDASVLQIRPRAVVYPKTTDDIRALVLFAGDQGLSLHPRGAGTGLAGESLGTGIILDLTRHLDRILEIGEDFVRVEPGVRFTHVQQTLAQSGRMLAVDPISGDRCTIGGMLATNAAGPHSLRYGTTRDHVLSVQGVLASGEQVDLCRVPVDGRESADNSERARIARQLARVIAAHAQAIQEEQPQSLIKHGGYELRGISDGRSVDLGRLMAGSEGTLAIATQITLATVPIPAYRGLLIASFASLFAAASAVIETLEYQPTACELLDRRLLSLVREVDPWYREWISDDAEAMLLIEHEGINPDNVVERIVLNQNRLTRVKRLALQTQEVYGEPGLSRCWRARDRAMPRLTRTADNVLPAPFVENTAVPPDRLPDFIAKVQNIMKRHGVTATYSAHAGVGILHARPLLDIHREIDRRRMPEIVEEMFEAVQECGGTFNGEHGVGPLRTGMLRRQYTKLYPAFERIKSIFDPYGVLNPGRIVNATSEFPIDLVRTARIIANDEPLSSTPQLRWPQLGLVETAERCNGCGACQSTNASVRMCPTYRAQSGEQQSPRALANLMRQWSHGELADAALTDPDFKRLVDHCVYCKMCRVECPTSVDISKLMLEAKAAYVAEEGLSRTDWFLANWASWSSWGSGQAHFANRLLAQPSARWLLEKAFGLSRRRRLLRLHHLTFLRRAQQAGWTKKPRPTRRREKYALFVDAYTNFHDPDLGEAVAKILLHHGHLVYVPIRQRPSGINYLQYGDIESARSQMMWNFEIAAELVREGYTLIATEPSAALMLRDEARHLMADTDLDVVANNTFEASEFFAREADLGRLATLPHEIPLAVAYHEPCHQRALDQRALPASLLKRIPGLRLLELELGCSGMAETYGLSARGHDRSLQAGKAMLSRVARGDVLAATTQCGACRLQIEEAAAKPTMHPVKLLAVALGLSDRPMDLFVKPQGRLLAP